VAALRAGDIDLALLRPPVREPEITVEVIRRDPLLALVPADHRLADRDQLSVADLRDEEFVAHVGQGRSVMSSLLAAACANAGFVPAIRHEVEETSTLVTLVAAGLGVAIVPAPAAALTISGVNYLPLTPATLRVDLLAARSTTAQNPLLDKVISVLRLAEGQVDWSTTTPAVRPRQCRDRPFSGL